MTKTSRLLSFISTAMLAFSVTLVLATPTAHAMSETGDNFCSWYEDFEHSNTFMYRGSMGQTCAVTLYTCTSWFGWGSTETHRGTPYCAF